VNLWRFTSFRVSFQNPSNLFRNSSSIHRLFVFVELRWAFCNEKRRGFWWIPELRWRFEQRSLRKLSGKLKTENKSVFSSSSSLIRSLLRFLFFSLLRLCDRLSFVTFVMNSSLNCRAFWFDDDEFARNLWESH
jgi:hypothetical protein